MVTASLNCATIATPTIKQPASRGRQFNAKLLIPSHKHRGNKIKLRVRLHRLPAKFATTALLLLVEVTVAVAVVVVAVAAASDSDCCNMQQQSPYSEPTSNSDHDTNIKNFNQTNDSCAENDIPQGGYFQYQLNDICNYDSSPKLIYKIFAISFNETRVKDQKKELEKFFCIAGSFAESFAIVRPENEVPQLMLMKKINQEDTTLSLRMIEKDENDYTRNTIGAIDFAIKFKDCNGNPEWQTIAVAVLASACVVLISSLSIMLILYRQLRSETATTIKDDEDSRTEELARQRSQTDETFINPRRTSSYDFNTLTRASTSGPDMKDIPEE